ncbi:hypothetical protein TanjilG_26133 [Lupinus angustifolius]|uniref:Uncharacterized protein n=1 Tax=Lupinus angustifolius TaxID=3871 RepID=A0A4P1R1Y2_LUPAN|nr:PREDICTED: uncharacterized protein LOC109361714 [Lupinus angustifolius]OIV99795.1 hypothetical protein TanjilG_26133 [Lupinus angustifolius]
MAEDKKHYKLQVDEDDDHEEALSLCDLPLNQNTSSKLNNLNDKSFKKIMVSPLHDSTELFEFFNGFTITTDMCPADDIISCGKLLPLKDKDKNILTEPKKPPPILRRRSESLSSLNQSNSVATCSRRLMMRNSRSMDYQRLDDVISPVLEYDRSFSTRSVVISEKKALKPRWYSNMFGTMKVPHEMKLNDIKNRQVRRNPSTSMFPCPDNGGVNRFSGKVSWRILKALSCKDPSSVTVTTSFPMPQAS